MFKATAIMTDGSREWPVTIFSAYESMDDAKEGVKRFRRTFAGEDCPVAVKHTNIEEVCKA